LGQSLLGPFIAWGIIVAIGINGQSEPQKSKIAIVNTIAHTQETPLGSVSFDTHGADKHHLSVVHI